VGFSYDPARDWAAAGVASFEGLQSPFLITTVRASEQLANSPIAGDVLRGLSGVGMVGIGLIPTEPRQILSTRPLFAPSSFDGLRLRIINNPETRALFAALHARPVQGVSAGQLSGLLGARSIEAVETSALPIVSNSYNAEAPYLSSYAVAPKFETIVATRAAWAALTASQQAAIRLAAKDTVANSQALPDRETAELTGLCQGGLVLDEPSHAQFTTLVRAAKRATPPSAQVAAMMHLIGSAIPGTGPRSMALPPPTGCHVAHSVAQAHSLHSLGAHYGSSRTGGPTIPPGTYVTTNTAAEFAAGDVTSAEFDKSMTEITTLYPDGNLKQIQRPTNPHQPRTATNGYYDYGGHYVVNGNDVTFFWDRRALLLPETLRWSYYNGQLSFSIIHVEGDSAGVVQYIDHPWRKVG
jgi:Bacterial extracellular solute-binding protein, family 7